jgi:6-phosphogluconate dehydrogenase
MKGDVKGFINDVRAALYCSKICSYSQGFAMIAAANQQFKYGMKLDEIARIWKAGCIIRAIFLDEIKKAFREHPTLTNLLMTDRFREAISQRQDAWRRVVTAGAQNGIGLPAFGASLAYYDGYRRERLPANLIQAQRDFFGAHTYERTDKPGAVHTEWSQGK